ncbi:FUSC family protein [Sphingomonas abaci]|uniref:Uncharacterized membrane protein YgaE (UPF0421/DUF939 family) n=1 Tax=Sphingomonas abaci TaxID=237611 RepID=A0A7W7F0K2_9SPHN|nr:FUSC family protein [Sphingomonas abaci]MBB4618425.1 uncharacterized membrane protein YgaE (UPF0421/DUF939 family) [Sphingomonas abaci]
MAKVVGAPFGRLRAVAFVLRCTAAAVVAAAVAQRLGLGHPVWACVSALVVSQDRIGDTHRALGWRVAATLIGLVVALLSATVLPGGSAELRLALAVGIAASITRWRAETRVCMWTAVIVLTTVPPGGTVVRTGLDRAQEVLLGALIGAVLHQIAEGVILRLERRAAARAR